MDKMDQLAQTLAILGPNPIKAMVPNIGHRMVTKTTDGRIVDTSGQDFTSAFNETPNIPKQEFHEDGQRKSISELSQHDLPTLNSTLLKGNQTLRSFKDMKQHILHDFDIDTESIRTLNIIEQQLTQFLSVYLNKKEELRINFKM